MQGLSSTLIPFDSKIKRIIRVIWKARRESQQNKEELEEEREDMAILPRQMIGYYCRRIDVGQISLGF